MIESARPEGVSCAEEYLGRCLVAIRKDRPLPDPPPELAPHAPRVEQAVAKLHEIVAEERRERSRRKRRRTPVPTAVDDPLAVVVPGYSPLRLLGEGAFGKVVEAEDHHLRGRRVALKILHKSIPDTYLDDERWETIFGEAKRTAILNHQNIVRCHESGLVTVAPGERRAFFVMDLILGETLHEFVDREREVPGLSRRARFADAYQRRMAGLFATIAGAVGAVHAGKADQGLSPGVHGDLSPTNILIDKDGQPHLIDFGLAVNRRERGPRGGTPGYAAPEVDRPVDLNDPIGPEADVYSLGALLHFALIGAPPGRPAGPEAPRPVALAGIAPDLDAIRRMCLAPDPRHRYRTGRELTDDLGRFLAGEPVKARPVSLPRKALKWCGRQPLGALAIALVLAAGALAIWFGAAAYYQGRVIETQGQDIEQKAREIAGYQSALDATLPLVDLVAPKPSSRDDDPLPDAARRKIATRLMPFFDKVADARGDDPATRAVLAEALVGRAKLRRALGRPEDDEAALADLRRADDLYESLPETLDREIARAGAIMNRVGILGPQGRFAEGLEAIEPAVAQLEAAVDRAPGRADARFYLALALSNRANCRRALAGNAPEALAVDSFAQLKEDGRARLLPMLDAAEADYWSAIRHMQVLTADPADPVDFEWLSRLNGNLGLLLTDLISIREDAAEDARVAFRHAVGAAEDLTARTAESPSALDALAAASLNLGDGLLATAGPPAEAEDSYRRALAIYERLHQRDPVAREFAWGRATARRQIGDALAAQGRKAEARAIWTEALGLYDQLIETYPNAEQIPLEREAVVKAMETTR